MAAGRRPGASRGHARVLLAGVLLLALLGLGACQNDTDATPDLNITDPDGGAVVPEINGTDLAPAPAPGGEANETELSPPPPSPVPAFDPDCLANETDGNSTEGGCGPPPPPSPLPPLAPDSPDAPFPPWDGTIIGVPDRSPPPPPNPLSPGDFLPPPPPPNPNPPPPFDPCIEPASSFRQTYDEDELGLPAAEVDNYKVYGSLIAGRVESLLQIPYQAVTALVGALESNVANSTTLPTDYLRYGLGLLDPTRPPADAYSYGESVEDPEMSILRDALWYNTNGLDPLQNIETYMVAFEDSGKTTMMRRFAFNFADYVSGVCYAQDLSLYDILAGIPSVDTSKAASGSRKKLCDELSGAVPPPSPFPPSPGQFQGGTLNGTIGVGGNSTGGGGGGGGGVSCIGIIEELGVGGLALAAAEFGTINRCTFSSTLHNYVDVVGFSNWDNPDMTNKEWEQDCDSGQVFWDAPLGVGRIPGTNEEGTWQGVFTAKDKEWYQRGFEASGPVFNQLYTFEVYDHIENPIGDLSRQIGLGILAPFYDPRDGRKLGVVNAEFSVRRFSDVLAQVAFPDDFRGQLLSGLEAQGTVFFVYDVDTTQVVASSKGMLLPGMYDAGGTVSVRIAPHVVIRNAARYIEEELGTLDVGRSPLLEDRSYFLGGFQDDRLQVNPLLVVPVVPISEEAGLRWVVVLGLQPFCTPGNYLDPEEDMCIPCPEGTFQDESKGTGADACSACPVGSYAPISGLTACYSCALVSPFTYQNATGQEVCRTCPVNSQRRNGATGVTIQECVCSDGFHQVESIPQGVSCQPCPMGGVCEGSLPAGRNVEPYPSEGYWGDPQFPKNFIDCGDPAQCAGGIDFECGEGYRDFQCSLCDKDWYSVGGACGYQCDSDRGTQGLITFGGFLATTSMWFLMNSFSAGEYDGLDLLLMYLQIGDVIGGFGFDWTPLISEFQYFSSIVNFDVDYIGPQCFIEDWNYNYQFGLQMSIGLIVFSIQCFLHMISWLHVVARAKGWLGKQLFGLTEDRDSLEEGWDGIVKYQFSFYIVTYNALVVKVFSSFVCHEAPDGRQVLSAGPTLECWQGGHIVMVVMSIAGFFAYVVGIPLAVYWVTLRARSKNLLGTERHLRRYGFMYGRYETEWCWWELALLTRRFCMCSVLIFVGNEPWLQGFLGMIVVSCCLGAQFFARPFRVTDIDYLDSAANIANMIYILVGMLLTARPFGEENAKAMEVVLYSVIALTMATGVVVFLRNLLEVRCSGWAAQILMKKLPIAMLYHPDLVTGKYRAVIAEMDETFEKMDTDGDGELDRDELYQGIMGVMGYKEGEMNDKRQQKVLEMTNKLMWKCDKDGDGTLSEEEVRIELFKELMALSKKVEQARALKAAKQKAREARKMAKEAALKAKRKLLRGGVDSEDVSGDATPPRDIEGGGGANGAANGAAAANADLADVAEKLEESKSLKSSFKSRAKNLKSSLRNTFQFGRSGEEEDSGLPTPGTGAQTPTQEGDGEEEDDGGNGSALLQKMSQLDAPHERKEEVEKAKNLRKMMMRMPGGKEFENDDIVGEMCFTLNPVALRNWICAPHQEREMVVFHTLDHKLTPFLGDAALTSGFQMDLLSQAYRQLVEVMPCVLDWLLEAPQTHTQSLAIVMESVVEFQRARSSEETEFSGDPLKGRVVDVVCAMDRAPLAHWIATSSEPQDRADLLTIIEKVMEYNHGFSWNLQDKVAPHTRRFLYGLLPRYVFEDVLQLMLEDEDYAYIEVEGEDEDPEAVQARRLANRPPPPPPKPELPDKVFGRTPPTGLGAEATGDADSDDKLVKALKQRDEYKQLFTETFKAAEQAMAVMEEKEKMAKDLKKARAELRTLRAEKRRGAFDKPGGGSGAVPPASAPPKPTAARTGSGDNSPVREEKAAPAAGGSSGELSSFKFGTEPAKE